MNDKDVRELVEDICDKCPAKAWYEKSRDDMVFERAWVRFWMKYTGNALGTLVTIGAIVGLLIMASLALGVIDLKSIVGVKK